MEALVARVRMLLVVDGMSLRLKQLILSVAPEFELSQRVESAVLLQERDKSSSPFIVRLFDLFRCCCDVCVVSEFRRSCVVSELRRFTVISEFRSEFRS